MDSSALLRLREQVRLKKLRAAVTQAEGQPLE